VAEALRVLGLGASHVGHKGDQAPARGSSYQVVLWRARRMNQVVVTPNHDMISSAPKRMSL